jgi:hypothetical protein
MKYFLETFEIKEYTLCQLVSWAINPIPYLPVTTALSNTSTYTRLKWCLSDGAAASNSNSWSKNACFLPAVCLLGLSFDPEDGVSALLQNVDELIQVYMASHP